MANNYIARKNGAWKVVCIAPDMCKTPVGPSTPPVPYPVVAYLSSSESIVRNVQANGDAVFVYDKSYVSQTIGDQAGVVKGLKSNTVGGKCYPIDKSGTVRAGKKYLVRHNDKFWMNG